MVIFMPSRTLLVALSATFALAQTTAFAQSRTSSVAPPARFADPDRLAKLQVAFPAIDRIMLGFAERSHVPGIGYGIVVDGKVVHMNVAGYRELASHSPVDTSTVFRIASIDRKSVV